MNDLTVSLWYNFLKAMVLNKLVITTIGIRLTDGA